MHRDATSIVGDLRDGIVGLHSALKRSNAKQVQSKGVKAEVKNLVTQYFASTRPELTARGLDDESLAGVDGWMQDLLELSQRSALRSSYRKTLKAIEREANGIEVAAVVSKERLGATSSELDGREQLIATTLAALVPSAGLSYEQACADLRDMNRKSYRGSATELREALREVLDHLAPDKGVMSQPGFKLESNQTRPTMKQKTRFILRSRGVSKSLAEVPETAIATVEDKVGSLARSLYTRSSVSTHVATTLREVRQIKAYVDVLLGELLEIT